MTLQQLEYVVALDTYRNFVQAADSCFVTQPTLTMQVKKLEEEIGVQIFDRTKKPFRPTLSGERVVIKARQILREVNQLKEYLSSERQSLQGSFKIGIIPTLAPYLLPLFLPDFTRNNPETHLQILELQTDEIIKGINNDTLDIGILVTPLMEKSFREIVLFNEPFLVYHPAEHPFSLHAKINPDMLKLDEMLILDEGHCFRNQILNICNSDFINSASGFDYQNGSIESLKNLVNRGMGYTLVPELSIDESKDQSQVKRFTEPEPVREVSLVVHKSFTKELLIERLRKLILENIPEHFEKSKKYMKVLWR